MSLSTGAQNERTIKAVRTDQIGLIVTCLSVHKIKSSPHSTNIYLMPTKYWG